MTKSFQRKDTITFPIFQMDTFTFALNFNKQLQNCTERLVKKMQDHGSSWRILSLWSLDDQIHQKAKRSQRLRGKGVAKGNESAQDELVGLVNYSLIGLIQMRLKKNAPLELSYQKCLELVDRAAEETLSHMVQIAKYPPQLASLPMASLEKTIMDRVEKLKNGENPPHERALHYHKIIFYSIFALIQSKPKQYIP